MLRVSGTLTLCALCIPASGIAQTALRPEATSALAAKPPTTSIPHRFLVAYRNATIPEGAESSAKLSGVRMLRRNERSGVALVESAIETADAAALAQLRSMPNVEYVIHDRLVQAHSLLFKPTLHALGVTANPNQPPVAPPVAASADPDYISPQGWAVRQVGGYGANTPGGPAVGPWSVTQGQGVRIAILDSGIDANHPDLAPNLAYNLSEIDQSPATGLPSPCDDGTPEDQTGHGTWAASLAAAAMGQATGRTIGVAPSATLLNIKVLERMPDPTVTSSDPAAQCVTGQGSGLLSWVLQGIEDAVAQHADVINLSLGTLVDLETGEGAGLKAVFDRVTYAAAQAGAIIVASAGNDAFDLSNPRYVELPAQARSVLAIVASTNSACAENTTPGATCAAGPVTLPYYSNFGAPLNALAAPGGSYPDGPETGVSGWIRGACSTGLTNTSDGPPSDPNHSYGCFDQGHTPYVQAIGTSASSPLAAGVAALIRAANPTWTAAQVIATMRSTAVKLAGMVVPQISASAALNTP